MTSAASLTRDVPLIQAAESVEAVLAELAPALDLWMKKDPAGGWLLTGGELLATNPNDVRWTCRVTSDVNGIHLAASFRALPWERPRMRRLVSYRLNQLGDQVSAKITATNQRIPWAGLKEQDRAPFFAGPAVADKCFAFAGSALTMLVSCMAVMAVVSAAGILLIDATVEDLTRRALALKRLGLPVIPPLHDLSGLGSWGRVEAALHLALPVSFFLGGVQAATHALNDLWRRCTRMPLGAFFFMAVASALSFGPSLPHGLGVLAAALIPAAAIAGTSIVWSLRSEKVRTAADPVLSRRPVAIAAVLALAAVAATLIPALEHRDDLTEMGALFRDRYVYTHPVGRRFAESYYRHTLYAAEVVKTAYDGRKTADSSRQPYDKQAPLALVLVEDPAKRKRASDKLREFKFIAEEGQVGTAKDRAHDVYVTDGSHVAALEAAGVGNRILVAPDSADSKAWEAALLDASRAGFRAGFLLDLVGSGWFAIYAFGLPFWALIATAPLAALAGLLHRRAGPRTAVAVVAVAFLSAAGALGWVLWKEWPEMKALREFRATGRDDPAALEKGLSSEWPSVRHEAAYRSCRTKAKAPAAALLKAVDDPDFRVRLWAVAALGRTRDPSALEPLIMALEDRELFVRYRACEGLGELEAGRRGRANKAVVEALLRVIRERSWYEASYAYGALRKIDPSKW